MLFLTALKMKGAALSCSALISSSIRSGGPYLIRMDEMALSKLPSDRALVR